MLKKLRWKFILIITALLAGMLAAALAVICNLQEGSRHEQRPPK